ncbi:MAG: hypothetical protein HY377_00790 [Candidatus Blackburnbacteria bacterium]|nr:hypothetical protein [Candidatus Blackburnbacteria bacterium]
MKFWQSWKYKNLTILFLGIIVALVLSRIGTFQAFLANLGNYGYIGALLAGVLFVSVFTVASGIVILSILAQTLSPLEIGLIAGAGAVLGDFVIFRFIKDNLIEEVAPLYRELGGAHLTKLLHTKYFSWTLPVIGALIIASPFPDELGISLMGLSRIKTYQFLLLSFILNSTGIFLIISAARLIT